ncbi:MAG: hypothetical protein JNK02_08205 [Planctomycetes bacterium]|nr:hypothetical protein [Planctomycetota bacterium]
MSKIGAVIALTGGGIAVFSMTYLGIAAAQGAAIREIPPFSWLARDLPEPAPRADAAPPPPPLLVEKAPVVQPMTAGVLGAFVLPSPFDSRELHDLQQKLSDRLARVEATEKDLERRARELDDWERSIQERLRELSSMREEIDGTKPAARAAGEAAPKAATSGSASESWRSVAPLFEDGDVEDLAAKLAGFEPAEAAEVLKGLEPERAAALLNALPKDKFRPFLEAWRKARD